MSDSEMKTLPASEEKKLINSQTQHGNEETADEENIVVLATSFSPIREDSDEVVWHEDFYDVSLTFPHSLFCILFCF